MEVYFNEGLKQDIQAVIEEPFDKNGIGKMDGKRGACVVLALIEVREAIQELDATLREIGGVNAKVGVTFERFMAEALGSFKVARGVLEAVHGAEHREKTQAAGGHVKGKMTLDNQGNVIGKGRSLGELSAEDQKKSGVTLNPRAQKKEDTGSGRL